MDRCEQAVGYHKKGFNCCQSVLAAFQDVIGLTETQCLTLGGGFGAGAGTGELCGAVTGAVMVLDLLTPADPADVIGSKKRSVGQAKELQKRFAERFDALRCADLLQKKFVPDDASSQGSGAYRPLRHYDLHGGRDRGADAGGATITVK